MTKYEQKLDRGGKHAIAPGVSLILIGTASQASNWFNIGNSIVLFLGLAMLVWGCVFHQGSWIIPGGVLTGIGLGILALAGPWHFSPSDQSAIFLICFACGWFLISLLTFLFARLEWWPLIPGGIMALIGAVSLVANGVAGWLDSNLVFAFILIGIGLILLVFRGRSKKND